VVWLTLVCTRKMLCLISRYQLGGLGNYWPLFVSTLVGNSDEARQCNSHPCLFRWRSSTWHMQPTDYPLLPFKMRFPSPIQIVCLVVPMVELTTHTRMPVYPVGNVCISILHTPGDDPTMYEQARCTCLLSSFSLESGANFDCCNLYRENKAVRQLLTLSLNHVGFVSQLSDWCDRMRVHESVKQPLGLCPLDIVCTWTSSPKRNPWHWLLQQSLSWSWLPPASSLVLDVTYSAQPLGDLSIRSNMVGLASRTSTISSLTRPIPYWI